MPKDKEVTENNKKVEDTSKEGPGSSKSALSTEAANTEAAAVRNAVKSENQRVQESTKGLTPDITVSDAVSEVLSDQATDAIEGLLNKRNKSLAGRSGSNPIEAERAAGNLLELRMGSAEFGQVHNGNVWITVSDQAGKSKPGELRIHPDWLEETPSGIRIRPQHENEVLGRLNSAFFQGIQEFNKFALEDRSMDKSFEEVKDELQRDRELRKRGKLGPENPRNVKPAEIRNTRPVEITETPSSKIIKGGGTLLGVWMLLNAAVRHHMTPSEEL